MDRYGSDYGKPKPRPWVGSRLRKWIRSKARRRGAIRPAGDIEPQEDDIEQQEDDIEQRGGDIEQQEDAWAQQWGRRKRTTGYRSPCGWHRRPASKVGNPRLKRDKDILSLLNAYGDARVHATISTPC